MLERSALKSYNIGEGGPQQFKREPTWRVKSILSLGRGKYKSDNLQYNTVGRWVDGTMDLPSDGPMFNLINWE